MNHPNELDQQLENLRTLQQSYDQIAGAAEAYNVGKTELAAAITAKGVATDPTETYPEMADKVTQIVQTQQVIDGGEMYAKQLFGSLTTPNYWNLYEVLAQLLSDGRLVNYGGILLAEYYKGYDSIALSGAGSGGAYVVSDKDSDGNFIMYTNDTTHTWATEEDGKGNRWVAYCFADAGHGFTISNFDTCPRSIHIGRHVGVIESVVAGRVSNVVCTDGNTLDDFRSYDYTQNWDKRVVLRLNGHNNTTLVKFDNNSKTESLYFETNSDILYRLIPTIGALQSVIIKGNGVSSIPSNNGIIYASGTLGYVNISGFDSIRSIFLNTSVKIAVVQANSIKISSPFNANITYGGTIDRLYLYIDEASRLSMCQSGGIISYAYIGITENSDPSKVLNFGDSGGATTVELQGGILKTINLSGCGQSMTAEWIATKILDKLGTCTEETGQLILKIGATNLATIQNDVDYSSYLTDAVDNKGWSVIA